MNVLKMESEERNEGQGRGGVCGGPGVGVCRTCVVRGAGGCVVNKVLLYFHFVQRFSGRFKIKEHDFGLRIF